MTDYNYKQLCAELLRAMDELEECEVVDWSLVKTQPLKMASQSMAEVRAALDEPDPEGPTDSEIDDVWNEQAAYFALYDEARCFARAVLARWGRPAPNPIPVSERLPEMDDCDADGRCWVGYLVTEEMEDEDLNPSWELCQINPNDEYWLPAHALPVPS